MLAWKTSGEGDHDSCEAASSAESANRDIGTSHFLYHKNAPRGCARMQMISSKSFEAALAFELLFPYTGCRFRK
jgi:hypothetical protein